MVTDPFDDALAPMFQQPVYGLGQQEKQRLLMPLFNQLHQWHMQKSESYIRLFGSMPLSYEALSQLPYMAVRMFKHDTLASIPDTEIFKILNSSGTTAQAPAKVILDRATSARQSKTLVKIMQQWIGKQRLPMLIADSPDIVNNSPQFSARAAGIQGLAFFGRDHTYALDENMMPDWDALETFSAKYQGQAILLFGFTFMLWTHLIEPMRAKSMSCHFEHAIALHSGGWKKLEAQKVDNKTFKQGMTDVLGIHQIHNFYGMAEQVGSVFVECEHGHLHSPLFADVIIRDPFSLEPCGVGKRGLVQVLSVLPTSYPGFSVLTEDLGVLLGEDDCPCGRKGRYFRVEGRLPKVEVRGCSDTQPGQAS